MDINMLMDLVDPALEMKISPLIFLLAAMERYHILVGLKGMQIYIN